MNRCAWAQSEQMIAYHDAEWGVPIHDDRVLFEFLILEGAQAGLSWSTILKKREAYRQAFDGFDPARVAAYDEAKRAELLANPGIVRNRLKIAAAITNAQAFVGIQEEFARTGGSAGFDAYVWRFVGGQPKRNAWREMRDLPATSAESDALSKDLSRRGLKFVGSTICYAFMQAVGMVNDHTTDCFRYAQLV
jgi:DNA-3-methyladenine glycosylase I